MIGALNTILYGPPGTGKTYRTLEEAVKIASSDFNPSGTSAEVRKAFRAEYEKLRDSGQIAFVTFHQSTSYEDFIEGIKPVKPIEGDAFLKYVVRDGIFKELALKAAYRPDVKAKVFSLTDDEFAKAEFHKMSLGDSQDAEDDIIYKYCLDNSCIAIGWGDIIDYTGKTEKDINEMVRNKTIDSSNGRFIKHFVHFLKPGDYVVVSWGNSSFRAIGKITGGYEFKPGIIRYPHFRQVEWLLKDVQIPVQEIYDRGFQMQTLYQLDKSGLKKEFFVKAATVATPVDDKLKNYVLIIDEINRGNISAVFGELITLIEEDKRSGGKEALSAILPYSGEAFTVPSNLYILGTMNTADRSVEALDTALRRRFSFIEMEPNDDHELIPVTVKVGDKEHQPREILKKINMRLEKLLGRDHKIGHSYFIGKNNWEQLRDTFAKNIIPLLQEYFFGDYARIALVLGEGFIEKQTVDKKDKFFASTHESLEDLLDKEVWRIKNVADMRPAEFSSALDKISYQ